MTAVNKDGQFYFIFEELDFDGAIKEVLSVVKNALELIEVDGDKMPVNVYNSLTKKIDKYLKISLYLERLKRGHCYV